MDTIPKELLERFDAFEPEQQRLVQQWLKERMQGRLGMASSEDIWFLVKDTDSNKQSQKPLPATSIRNTG